MTKEFIKFFDNCLRDDYLDFLIVEDPIDGTEVLQASSPSSTWENWLFL